MGECLEIPDSRPRPPKAQPVRNRSGKRTVTIFKGDSGESLFWFNYHEQGAEGAQALRPKDRGATKNLAGSDVWSPFFMAKRLT